MKKLIAAIVVLVMIFGIYGCGKKKEKEFIETVPTTTEITTEETTTEETTVEATTEATTKKQESDTSKPTTKPSNKSKPGNTADVDNKPIINPPSNNESGNLDQKKEEKPADPVPSVADGTTASQKQPAGDVLEPVGNLELYAEEGTGNLLVKLTVKNPTSFSYKPLEFEVVLYNESDAVLDTFYYDVENGINPNSTEELWFIIEKSEPFFNDIAYVIVNDVYEYEM